MLKIAQLCGLVILLVAGQAARAQESPSDHPVNVLFISVDDLRPAGESYGAPEIHTPNMDRLAQRDTAFTRAYVQQAVCSPSRTSVLTGRRPETTGIRDLTTHFRVNLPDVVTLPQYFKEHGYHAQAVGKIYHARLDDPQSWSVPAWFPAGDPGFVESEEYAWGKPETIQRLQKERDRLVAEGHQIGLRVTEVDPDTGTELKVAYHRRFKGPSWEDADVPDEALPDGKVARNAIEALRHNRDRPFFLAVGFYRPHLPLVAPKHDFDLYPLDEIRLPENYRPPKGVPEPALPDWGELRSYRDIPSSGPLSDQQAREIIRAYYASTTYVDRQIGRVLDELERLGLGERTIVVLWSDHGYHLGEQARWTKHTNFEIATRAPLIVSIPGGQPSRSDALVEFVDLYHPYRVKGDSSSGLLPEITGMGVAEKGRGDRAVQAYNFRMCVCQRDDRISITEPDGYDASRYELLVRLIESQSPETLQELFIISGMPNGKTDWNNRGGFRYPDARTFCPMFRSSEDQIIKGDFVCCWARGTTRRLRPCPSHRTGRARSDSVFAPEYR